MLEEEKVWEGKGNRTRPVRCPQCLSPWPSATLQRCGRCASVEHWQGQGRTAGLKQAHFFPRREPTGSTWDV